MRHVLTRRAWWRVVPPLLLGLTLLAATLALQATPAAPSPLKHTIDWAHPLSVTLVSEPSGIATLPDHTVPVYVPAQASTAVQPQTGWPSCVGNIYRIIVGGKVIWTLNDGFAKVSVEYYWCRRWNGDTAGINWAVGTATMLNSGCAWAWWGSGVAAQKPTGTKYGIMGASIRASYFTYGDAVNYHYALLCSGQTLYDNSIVAPGDGLYGVRMAVLFDQHGALMASSPCCH